MSQGRAEPASGAFEAPESFLAGLEPGPLEALVTASSDFVLMIDGEGVIRDLAVAPDDLVPLCRPAWVGRRWMDVVTVESRPKIEVLLQEATAGRSHRWRQVTHPDVGVGELPVSYCVVPLPSHNGHGRRLLAFGRDLRSQAALQQRVVNAQLSMERDYWRLRHVETRYRLLLQSVAEPVLVLDAATDRLEECNPAAEALLGDALRRPGWLLTEAVDPADRDLLRSHMAAMRASGRFEPAPIRLVGHPGPITLWAALFRQENSSRVLVRLIGGDPATEVQDGRRMLQEVVDAMPDAVVVTDLEGRVINTNQSFLDLSQLARKDLAMGASLERWLGRGAVDLNVLLSNLRQRGSVRMFATQLRGEFGSQTDVEISAASLPEAERPCMAFVVRDVGLRIDPADARASKELPRSVGQMKELVGRLPLKDIVRETTDLIEQLCIEAALELTGDNRASAAEMLGLSRQSLYVKLRRFGIGGADFEPAEPSDPTATVNSN